MASIEAKMRAIVEKYPEHAATITHKIAFEAWTQIVNMMPVDLGTARANTQLTLGSNEPQYIEMAPDKTGQPPHYEIGAEPYAVIVNPLPYIKSLNEGSSKQAPRNFIEIGILNALDQRRTHLKNF